MTELTADYVRSILNYEPVSGIVRWQPRPLSHFIDARSMKTWNTKNAGMTAGTFDNSRGVITVSINKKRHKIHRLIWLIMTGEWPANLVEHEDLNPANNRWDNLREANKAQNSMNRIAPRNNTSGFKGAVYFKRDGNWMGKIKVNGKTLHLGYFTTPEAAHAAYCVAANKYFGEFARTA